MCYRGRNAVSGYRVVQALGDGSSALVEWQLQTGRTHQIRSARLLHLQSSRHQLLYLDPRTVSQYSTVSTYRGIAFELNASWGKLDLHTKQVCRVEKKRKEKKRKEKKRTEKNRTEQNRTEQKE